MTTNKNKECKEYNSLKYRTMIMTGKDIDQKMKHESSQAELDSFLVKEQTANKKQSWSKLSKTERLKKIDIFINSHLIKTHSLSEEEVSNLNVYVANLLERKKLIKSNEILYNEDDGLIEEMPALLFNNKMRKFTLNKELSNLNKKNQRKTKKNGNDKK